MDETPFSVAGSRSSHSRVAVGDGCVHFTAAGTCAGTVPDEFYPCFLVPLTCDGYKPCRRYENIQGCWMHLLREAGMHVSKGRAERSRCKQLQLILHEARHMSPDHYCAGIIPRVKAIAAWHTRGHSYDGRLAAAAPHMITVARHPGKESTSNRAGGAVQDSHAGGIRFWLCTPTGTRMLRTIMTCIWTWRMRGPDVPAALVEALTASKDSCLFPAPVPHVQPSRLRTICQDYAAVFGVPAAVSRVSGRGRIKARVSLGTSVLV